MVRNARVALPRRGHFASPTSLHAVLLPAPSPSVVFQKLDDGAVLFAPETETYFGLNEAGALIWRLLPPTCATLDEMSAELSARFSDVPAATIRQDAEELLEALVREGLARALPSDGGDAPAAA